MRKRIEKNHLFTTYKLTALLVLLNFAVIFSLLVLMTHSDTQSTNITDYSNNISTLSIKNQVLQEKIADAQNIDQVYQKAQTLGMHEADNILYVTNSNAISYNMEH